MNNRLRDKVFSNGDLPRHIAIIMDGNGRWARLKNKPRAHGHREGINSVREIVQVCGEIGISHLTLYTFSSENWSRPKSEVSAIMKLLLSTIKKEINNLHKNNVKLSTIGNINDLPNDTRKNIMDGIAKTQNNSGLNLILALSYGSRQELIRAFKRIGKKIQSSEIAPDDINENLIGKELYSKDIPDPDLLIRTGGEFRLSNFLLWQAAYSELLITDTHWPDFREEALLNGIYEYQNRQRRFGQTAEQITA
ncbi:MAG: isoprenyl transferase [Candidatus Neomarinimicrobiota bacterium]|nr:isoprenyl transferase [Candidatus Neomarinimicrobiota bacterium]MEC9474483.1 isoprenyl transferase [Candidatus Neomarinimicrobiota bacterium]